MAWRICGRVANVRVMGPFFAQCLLAPDGGSAYATGVWMDNAADIAGLMRRVAAGDLGAFRGLYDGSAAKLLTSARLGTKDLAARFGNPDAVKTIPRRSLPAAKECLGE